MRAVGQWDPPLDDVLLCSLTLLVFFKVVSRMCSLANPLKPAGADSAALAAKQAERSEASSLLERRMAAMEAILTSRRKLLEAPPPPEEKIPDIFQPPPVSGVRRWSLRD